MIPPELGQAPDDMSRSSQDIDVYKRNGNSIDEDRSSPEKLISQPNGGDGSIDGIRYFENKVISDYQCSADQAPDIPDSVLLTDSGEDLTDDDSQESTIPPFSGSPESSVNNSEPYYQRPRLPDVPSKRRPIRENEATRQNREQSFIIAKDEIIEFIKEFQDKISINKKIMASIVFVIILSIVYNFVRPVNESSPMSMQYYIREEILNQYPMQDKRDLKNLIRVIDNVNIGKREIDKVAVITILYSHRQTAECLAKTTANYAVKVLNRNQDFVRLNGSLSNDDFYLGNEQLKKDIEGKGVLVVYDFHNFPAEKVRYFHGICDKHTPYIKYKAVYIILLELSEKQEEISKKLEKVQSRIEELWRSNLKTEILNPLGTRLMDNVMVVRQEPKLVFC